MHSIANTISVKNDTACLHVGQQYSSYNPKASIEGCYTIQKEVRSNQKQPSCKKVVRPLKTWVKKVLKSKVAAHKLLYNGVYCYKFCL